MCGLNRVPRSNRLKGNGRTKAVKQGSKPGRVTLSQGFPGVQAEELKKVPYLTHIPSDGRSVFLQPFFDKDASAWKMFIPQGPKLTWIFSEPVECHYFSETNADPQRDMYLKLTDVITRCYSYPFAMDVLLQLVDKIIFSAVVVEKYFLSLIRYRVTRDPLIANLVTTDLEYLFANARSEYDLLQKLFSNLWDSRTGIKMKGSFRKVVQKSRKELQSQYSLPEPILEYYMSSKNFFLKIRAIRDAIFHPPVQRAMQPLRPVLCDDDGFAVMNRLFNSFSPTFDIWPQEKTKPNGLVSVLALISYVNKMILDECDRFSDALLLTIPPPPAITESHKLFLRSPYVHHHLKAEKYLEEQWVRGDLGSRLTPSTTP